MASDGRAAADPEDGGRGRVRSRVPRFDRPIAAVVAVSVAALLVRVAGLGNRPFHWDEARVGYWALRFLRTGAFDYRPVAGGPLLYHADRAVFVVLDASNFAARLPVAVVGGLLPLAALSFRGRLRDDETVALALFLAANPLLVYYSRFLRGDVLLAAFGLAAVGLAVRLADTGRRRYLYVGAAAFALALAASGFVVGSLVCWLVAAALVFDYPHLVDRGPPVGERLTGLRRRVDGWSTPVARAVLLFVGITVFLFAPRAGGGDGPGLWRPTTFPAVLDAALVGSVRSFLGVRALDRASDDATHQLLPYVADVVGTLGYAAFPLTAFALLAFLADRYRTGGPRSVVAFHGYWGLAALVVFPLISEVNAPWTAVHAVVPLSVPAAVGAAALFRFGADAATRRDAANVAAVVLLVVAVASQAGAVAAGDVYGPSEPGNLLVQYAQPADDLDLMASNASAAIDGNDGVDVVYVGERFRVPGPDPASPPVSEAWGTRLPLPWYFERIGAETDGVGSAAELSRFGDPPPVVVADPSERSALASRLEGYDEAEYRLSLWNRRVVVFVRN